MKYPKVLESQHNQENGAVHQIMEETTSQVAVVMVPLPAQGHINQLLHLSRLIAAYNLSVHYVGTAAVLHQAQSRVHGWDPSSISNVHFQEFQTPSFSNPPPNPNAPTKFPVQIIPSLMASTHLRQPVHKFVNELSTKHKRVVVIYEFYMSYVVQDIESIPNAEAYCFRCAAAFTTLCFQLERTAEELKPVIPPELAEILKETPSTDGCIPPDFYEFANMNREARNICSGDIFDSNRELEGGLCFDLIAKMKRIREDNMWGLGPFNPVSVEKNSVRRRDKCLNWLDNQGPDSVMYVSFGSMTSLSDEEIKAIAFGLERSEQKFIWVLREADRGDIFSGGEDRKLDSVLPEGFEERTKDKGMIVRDWAPQLEILGHLATGGFLSHCGWNSSMESISMGVPIVAWPMHSDQPRNAVFLTKVLRIGVEVVKWERRRRGEMVSGEAVEAAVREVMLAEGGEAMRRRARELGDRVRKSVMKGGATRRELDSFIALVTR